jgi:hypothetical protein
MSAAMQRYRELERMLIHMRWVHQGHECGDEEALVEAMAEGWYALTADEQNEIRAEGPKTLLPEDLGSPAHHEWEDVDPPSGTPFVHRELREVA